MNSKMVVSGSVTSGSRCSSANSQKAEYMPSIRNSPCEKLTMSITPKMMVRPTATSA